MLFLASNGLTSAPLLAAVQTAAAGKRTAALVVTADPVYKEKNRHAARCLGELTQLGLSAEIFDIDCRPPAGLLGFDVVELMGGNPYYLLHSIREHQAEEVLRKLAEERLLIGWSAGGAGAGAFPPADRPLYAGDEPLGRPRPVRPLPDRARDPAALQQIPPPFRAF